MARRRFISQAAEEALVRFNPEKSALLELLRQAGEDRRTTVRQARGTAAGTVAAVNQARPEVKGIYRDAGIAEARIAHTLDEGTAPLGPVARSIQAGIDLERAQGGRHLEESKAAALTDLSDRKVRAREGAQWAVTNAGNVYRGEVGKVRRRVVELAREEGAFTAGTARELETAAQTRGDKFKLARMGTTQSERNSLRTAGIDPDTGKPIKGGKLDPKGKANRVSNDKHLEWQTKIEDIASYARKYKGKLNRQQIVDKLSRGRPRQTVLVDRNGNPLPEGLSGPQKAAAGARKVPLPSIPAFDPNLQMSAALDVALDGRLSRKTQQRLHRAGFSLAQLGLPTYGEWLRQQRRTSRPPLAAGPRGQQRPT
jgi:hypothetical protein